MYTLTYLCFHFYGIDSLEWDCRVKGNVYFYIFIDGVRLLSKNSVNNLTHFCQNARRGYFCHYCVWLNIKMVTSLLNIRRYIIATLICTSLDTSDFNYSHMCTRGLDMVSVSRFFFFLVESRVSLISKWDLFLLTA